MKPVVIDALDAACEWVAAEFRRHPERDATAAFEAAVNGKRRRYPVLYLSHLASPDDVIPPPDDLVLPEVRMGASPEADLAREVIGMLEPLKMLNPISPAFGLGRGTGTLVTCFGIPLNPEACDARAFTKPIEQILSEPPPDPENSGLLPEIRARIERIKAHTPSEFKIRLPDLQGPFNVAHSTVGEEIFTAALEREPQFQDLMQRVTDLWIAVRRNLVGWIGGERLYPPDRWPYVAECSVNLVSTAFYREWVLPHDRRVVEAFGPVRLHPCSGPHVFHVTLEQLPAVGTEAGFIAKTAAGSIGVDEARRAIGDRPILLQIGQEPPEGKEFEFIRDDLDRYAANPRLLFSYTGMHWRRKDRPRIREIHRRLDRYWDEKYG